MFLVRLYTYEIKIKGKEHNMENKFYQTSEYKPVKMTKSQLIDHLTKRQDECYDEKLTETAYMIPDIFKANFVSYFRDKPLPKTVFVFSKDGTRCCGGFWQSQPTGTLKDPVKITVATKRGDSKYDVLDFDWDDTFYGKNF